MKFFMPYNLNKKTCTRTPPIFIQLLQDANANLTTSEEPIYPSHFLIPFCVVTFAQPLSQIEKFDKKVKFNPQVALQKVFKNCHNLLHFSEVGKINAFPIFIASARINHLSCVRGKFFPGKSLRHKNLI